ncbi:hypothetical protein ASD80_13470 [Devosia sp. Root635]|nr:hypothetical protein ASD80_13470 [Devosia sp. Root635]
MMMALHHIGGSIASLPLEGRDRGWGSIGVHRTTPSPALPSKGEGAQEPQALIEICREYRHG